MKKPARHKLPFGHETVRMLTDLRIAQGGLDDYDVGTQRPPCVVQIPKLSGAGKDGGF